MKEYKKAAAKSHAEKVKAYSGHPDERQDRSLVDRMVKKQALTGRADGGETSHHKGKGKSKGTQVNVIVAPRGGDRAVPPPVNGQGPVPAPAMPSQPAGPVPPRPNQPPVMVAAPSGGSAQPPLGARVPPQGPIGAKRGGKIACAKGGTVKGYTAGAESGLGRLEKAAHIKKKLG